MEPHPYADLFPMMAHEDAARLSEDIRTRGYDPHFPIVTYEGKILDGRNRWDAVRRLRLALESGHTEVSEGVSIEPVLVEYDGDDPLGFVVSANLSRRHLNASQRAVVAERLATMGEGRPTKTAGKQAVSQASAAHMLNVSRDSVQKAREVKQHAPDLIPAVERGEMSVSKAAKEARERKKPPPRPGETVKPKDTRTISTFVDASGLLSFAKDKDPSARKRISAHLRSLADAVDGLT